MKQYHFAMSRLPSGSFEIARVTAATEEIARLQLIVEYGYNYRIGKVFDVQEPHKTYGELNCSDFPLNQIEWLRKEAAKV